MRTIRTGLAVVLPLTVAAAVATAGTAQAKNGEVRKSGPCPAASTWKLKAAPDNGRLQVEFEVDSNVVGQTWNWKFFDNGAQVAAGTSKTIAPSGSFDVRRLIANKAGADTIRARAANPVSGEVCQGVLTI
jgi:PKD repeat protein